MDSFNTVFATGHIALTWNAVMLALAILTAVVVSSVIVKKRGMYKDLALDACIIGIPAGLIGARLFSALSGKIPFTAFFDLGKSGLNLMGALLFVGVGIAVYAFIKKLSVSEVFDALAPGAFFGLAVGRWSDFFLCDGLGPIVGDAVPKFFPLTTFTVQYFTDRHTVAYAVFFLDFLVCLALGVTALLLKKRRSGTASRVTITAYLFAEFILEWLREGSTRQIVFGEVRFNQIVLMAMLLFFVGLSLYLAKRTVPDREAPVPEIRPDEVDESKEEPAEVSEVSELSAEQSSEVSESPDAAAEAPVEVADVGEGDAE